MAIRCRCATGTLVRQLSEFHKQAGVCPSEPPSREALEQRVVELERANAELHQFVHVASHDLREPLRMIGCYVRLFSTRYRGRLDADADDFIRYAILGAEQVTELLDSLVAYARSTVPAAEPQ